jgi:carbonic anhydrase
MTEERPIQRLLEGVRRFHDQEFPRDHEIFEHLASGQHPHTLFITCADSRIVPELITQTIPGELFVCRNVGNIIPPFSQSPSDITAVLEYACLQLRVSEIVVCGHTDCGAMKALQSQEGGVPMPAVAAWLRNASAVHDQVLSERGNLDGSDGVMALVKQNVRLQLANLRTHPAVTTRLDEGSIEMHGWVYDIGAGTVGVFDPQERDLLPMDTVLAQLQQEVASS